MHRNVSLKRDDDCGEGFVKNSHELLDLYGRYMNYDTATDLYLLK